MQDGFSSEVTLISLGLLQTPSLKKKQSLQVYTSGIMSPQVSSSGFASVYKSLPKQYGNSESSSFNNTQSLQVYLVCAMFLTFLIFHQCQDTIVSAVKKSIFQWLISDLRLIILQRLDAIHFLSCLSVAVVDTKLVIHFGKSIPVIVIFTLIGIDHLVGDFLEAVCIGLFVCSFFGLTRKSQPSPTLPHPRQLVCTRTNIVFRTFRLSYLQP